ncbi:MAG: hypothetical protein A3C88_02060 [Candidatus Yanofskybacteria bacterium RIFCSPHIGHO2_02_FULL_50_12]|uniref:Hydrolase TatD n=1 Tax=Candidatus Yanofskybacteria bacterium RIFCSPHIGHO2_02_FULL_50_12 TaxID=1802685 RepID=A0A1F8FXE8_9BACT|nr:MAG: hypothetical protein A3C88_02060 [Candidatus Yanofskybacteria bacterium RIFCSPHIGHO2_02_FULL_50_12]
MKLFDSHCHPQFPQYDVDREEIITQALKKGVNMICVGTDLETSEAAANLANEYDGIWATVGTHPNDISIQQIGNIASSTENSQDNNFSDFEKLLADQKVVAMGEVGLDYYRTPEIKKQEAQKVVFKKFVELALKFDKPIVIHARDAANGTTGKVHQDIFEILRNKLSMISNHSLRGVAHSFTGSIEDAQQYIDLGFYIGLNGIITFADQYHDMIRQLPLDRILLETDAPYLAPGPYRGKRNEPAHVDNIGRAVAAIKGLSFEEVEEATTANCERLFGITHRSLL